jgi:branched-subunit amino acid transport protein
MNDASVWGVTLAGGVLTHASRLSFIGLLTLDRLPPLCRRDLRHMPAAVLGALILPRLTGIGAELDLTLGNIRLVAGVVAGIAAWRYRNMWLTIGVGMGVLWLLMLLS